MGKIGIDSKQDRKELYLLLDKVPKEEINSVRRYLQYLIDKVQEERLINALENVPFDDEPLTKREKKAIEIGQAEIERGEYISFDQYLKKRKSK